MVSRFNIKKAINKAGYVHTLPYSFCADTKPILDKVSVHAWERWFWHGFIKERARQRGHDLQSELSRIRIGFCATWRSVTRRSSDQELSM